MMMVDIGKESWENKRALDVPNKPDHKAKAFSNLKLTNGDGNSTSLDRHQSSGSGQLDDTPKIENGRQSLKKVDRTDKRASRRKTKRSTRHRSSAAGGTSQHKKSASFSDLSFELHTLLGEKTETRSNKANSRSCRRGTNGNMEEDDQDGQDNRTSSINRHGDASGIRKGEENRQERENSTQGHPQARDKDVLARENASNPDNSALRSYMRRCNSTGELDVKPKRRNLWDDSSSSESESESESDDDDDNDKNVKDIKGVKKGEVHEEYTELMDSKEQSQEEPQEQLQPRRRHIGRNRSDTTAKESARRSRPLRRGSFCGLIFEDDIKRNHRSRSRSGDRLKSAAREAETGGSTDSADGKDHTTPPQATLPRSSSRDRLDERGTKSRTRTLRRGSLRSAGMFCDDNHVSDSGLQGRRCRSSENIEAKFFQSAQTTARNSERRRTNKSKSTRHLMKKSGSSSSDLSLQSYGRNDDDDAENSFTIFAAGAGAGAGNNMANARWGTFREGSHQENPFKQDLMIAPSSTRRSTKNRNPLSQSEHRPRGLFDTPSATATATATDAGSGTTAGRRKLLVSSKKAQSERDVFKTNRPGTRTTRRDGSVARRRGSGDNLLISRSDHPSRVRQNSRSGSKRTLLVDHGEDLKESVAAGSSILPHEAELVNIERQRLGLRLLTRVSELDEAAQLAADTMAKGNGRVSVLTSYAGYIGKGKNVTSIHDNIMKFQNTRDQANILNESHTEFGIAAAKGMDGNVYVCQLFRQSFFNLCCIEA